MPGMANAVASAPTPAMAIGIANSTPGQAHWIWRSPSCGRERRNRAERALTTVVATYYLLGVSTRRKDKLVETLGITSLSKSQVSAVAPSWMRTVVREDWALVALVGRAG